MEKSIGNLIETYVSGHVEKKFLVPTGTPGGRISFKKKIACRYLYKDSAKELVSVMQPSKKLHKNFKIEKHLGCANRQQNRSPQNAEPEF